MRSAVDDAPQRKHLNLPASVSSVVDLPPFSYSVLYLIVESVHPVENVEKLVEGKGGEVTEQHIL